MPQESCAAGRLSAYDGFVHVRAALALISSRENVNDAAPRPITETQQLSAGTGASVGFATCGAVGASIIDPSIADSMDRALALIVLSAKDEDDLRQALDEALGRFEFHPENAVGEPDLIACISDANIPIEVRELMLNTWFGFIAELVIRAATKESLIVPPWLNGALAHYVDAGNVAGTRMQELTLEDWQVLEDRRKSKEREFDELVQLAASSGQDAYSPFGHPDD
jgi:hypothetical protein